MISSEAQNCCHNGNDDGITDYNWVVPVGIVVVLGGYSPFLGFIRFPRGNCLSFVIILGGSSLPFLVIFRSGLG